MSWKTPKSSKSEHGLNPRAVGIPRQTVCGLFQVGFFPTRSCFKHNRVLVCQAVLGFHEV